MLEPYNNIFERRRAKRELPEVTRQISDLLRVGERIDHALETVAQLTSTNWLRQIMTQLKNEVRSGESLSNALRGYPELFSEYYVAVVAIGEAKGDIGTALRRISEQLLRQQRFSDALTTALSYPLLVLTVTAISLALMLVYVLPEFKELFEGTGTELPWFTDTLFRFAEMVRQYGLVGLCALGILAVFAKIQLQRPDMRYRWHRFLLRLPLVSGLVRRTDVVRFSDSLEAALAGGTTLMEGLRLSQASMTNRYLRDSLNRAIDEVKEGGRLGEGLHENCGFPLLASRMIQVGEESGNLKESLRHVAEVYDREFDITLKRVLSVLEPVLIVSIGAVIAVIVLTMISAIQELNNMPF